MTASPHQQFRALMISAHAFASDLDGICKHVDPLIEAIGDHVHSEFGISASDRKLFVGQLAAALDGNAMYVVTSAGEQVTENMADDEAEKQMEMRRVG